MLKYILLIGLFAIFFEYLVSQRRPGYKGVFFNGEPLTTSEQVKEIIQETSPSQITLIAEELNGISEVPEVQMLTQVPEVEQKTTIQITKEIDLVRSIDTTNKILSQNTEFLKKILEKIDQNKNLNTSEIQALKIVASESNDIGKNVNQYKNIAGRSYRTHINSSKIKDMEHKLDHNKKYLQKINQGFAVISDINKGLLGEVPNTLASTSNTTPAEPLSTSVLPITPQPRPGVRQTTALQSANQLIHMLNLFKTTLNQFLQAKSSKMDYLEEEIQVLLKLLEIRDQAFRVKVNSETENLNLDEYVNSLTMKIIDFSKQYDRADSNTLLTQIINQTQSLINRISEVKDGIPITQTPTPSPPSVPRVPTTVPKVPPTTAPSVPPTPATPRAPIPVTPAPSVPPTPSTPRAPIPVTPAPSVPPTPSTPRAPIPVTPAPSVPPLPPSLPPVTPPVQSSGPNIPPGKTLAAQPRTTSIPTYQYGLNETQRWLDAHNYYRKLHCAPPLKWNPKLAELARIWAQDLAKNQRQGTPIPHPTSENEKSQYLTIRDSTGQPCCNQFKGLVGQNLAYGPRRLETPNMVFNKEVEDVVADWYEEVTFPNFILPTVYTGQDITFRPNIEERRNQTQAQLAKFRADGTIPTNCTNKMEYKYGESPKCNPASGHFTQVVWKDSTEVGCVKVPVEWKENTYIWACNYNPPGNVYGRGGNEAETLVSFTQNVQDPMTCTY